MRLAAWVLLTAGMALAQWEAGDVVRSDGGQFNQNTIPQVATLGDGSLFAVWGARTKGDGNGKIYGTFSRDGARTWSAPKLLIDDPKFNDGDPNILVDGNTVWVFGTRVRIPNDIKKS